MLELMSAMVQGEPPHVPALLQSTLLPVSKPGGGILPIDKGKVWHRLAGQCALAACPDLGRRLVPLQLAVGIPGGHESSATPLAAGIAAEPGCLTMQLDLQNTFNTLSRHHMLQAVDGGRR
jgi:hypothetical protein